MKLKNALIEANIYDSFLEFSKVTSDEELENLFEIRDFKKGEVVSFTEEAGGKNGYVWNILKGEAKQIFYPYGSREYIFKLTVGEWIGVPGAVSNFYTLVDIEFLEDTQILVFPLGKMIRERPDIMAGIWERIARMMVNKFVWAAEQFINKSSMSNEAYFLKTIANNNYSFEDTTTKSLSESLGINLRTLQRIISSLEERKLIKRDKSKNKIWVEDFDAFDTYLDSLD